MRIGLDGTGNATVAQGERNDATESREPERLRPGGASGSGEYASGAAGGGKGRLPQPPRIEQAGQVIRRSYEFRDDYPAELMGKDSGPAPMENLMAALGACVASTYASQAAPSAGSRSRSLPWTWKPIST